MNNIRERVRSLLTEECKGKLDEFEDFELQSIYEHTLKNDGCRITGIYRNLRTHSVAELSIEKRNGDKDAFSLVL